MASRGYTAKAAAIHKDEIDFKQTLRCHKSTVLERRMLCIDPSCGSSSSMPGYAIFQAGMLVEAGTIELSLGLDLRCRLRELLEKLTQFDCEIVIIEGLPTVPVRSKKKAAAKGKTFMTAKAHNSLVQALGVTKAAFPATTPVLSLPATLWHKVARKLGLGMSKGEVVKSDELDAVRIGVAALYLLGVDISQMMGG